MSSTKYSIAAAHRITGKSRTTIAKHIKQGKISCERDEHSRPTVDASELIRFYGEACNFEREEGAKNGFKVKEINTGAKSEQGVQFEVNSFRGQLQKEIAERDREREQLESRITHLEATIEKALDVTLLIEDRSSEKNDWQASLDATIKQIANQTEHQIESLQSKHAKEQGIREKELLQLKRALKAERQKSLWQKLFA